MNIKRIDGELYGVFDYSTEMNGACVYQGTFWECDKWMFYHWNV